ncbi:hypothetical protein DPMN_045495 [Dreissena polymorpha]|uniref:Uncharacterized protein n=1 Tax=Dreissena polymorpha TaxID=45954 RepID=A0A9D4D659_DREPO|nr:hypothetical protein DPMN_045495 [Dreissena polymorpha]
MGVGIGSLLPEEQEAVRTTFQEENEGARRMGTRRIPYSPFRKGFNLSVKLSPLNTLLMRS